MVLEIWVGQLHVRQLPGTDHKIELSGKGAFTWVTSWAVDSASYARKVSDVMNDYGLFIVEMEQVMPHERAGEVGIVGNELAEQFRDTFQNKNYCIYGTFHNYSGDD
jgi:hypothetical protein